MNSPRSLETSTDAATCSASHDKSVAHVVRRWLKAGGADGAAQGREQQIRGALDSNRVIGTAAGIVMASYRLKAQQGFQLLVTASHNTNRNSATSPPVLSTPAPNRCDPL
jgi:hypothetical protein